MRHHVPAANRATEERQDAPLLEPRREQASRRRRGGAEARSVFGRDQFVPGGGVAQGDRGVRRGRGQLSDAGLVPGGPLRGRGGRRLGGAAANFGNAPASSATVGRLLVGGPVVARAANRSVLGGAAAGESQENALGSRSASAGRLPVDRTRQRVAAASRMVRQERHGRSAGGGFRLGREAQALCLPRPVARPQGRAVLASDGALARSVQRQFRRAAVRSDQHLLRGQRLRFARGRQAPPGNTADSKTLRTFLSRIEKQYGKARRVWVMDRGVPTEAVLAEMRASDPPVQYLVGTPKGRL